MKSYFILIFTLMLVGSAYAVDCTSNNDFDIGDIVNICSVGCAYRNESGSIITNCSDVTCKITLFYPNGTLIQAYQTMDFDGNQTFNYSLGNTSTLSDTVGVYTGKLDCYRDVGWTIVPFEWSVSSATVTITTVGGGGSRSYDIIDIANLTQPFPEETQDIILFFAKDWVRVGLILGVLGIILFILVLLGFVKFKKR